MPIGEWVLDDACRQAAEWRAAGHEDFVMAVNLWPAPALRARTSRASSPTPCATAACPPSALCLEITESAIMEDPEAAHAVLQGLKALGVRLAIDDFGVGYSSLSHLKYLLPVDVIKIDKSFVDGMHERGDTARSSPPIISLAQELGVGRGRRGRRGRRAGRRPARRWTATSRRATTSPSRCRRLPLPEPLRQLVGGVAGLVAGLADARRRLP